MRKFLILIAAIAFSHCAAKRNSSVKSEGLYSPPVGCSPKINFEKPIPSKANGEPLYTKVELLKSCKCYKQSYNCTSNDIPPSECTKLTAKCFVGLKNLNPDQCNDMSGWNSIQPLNIDECLREQGETDTATVFDQYKDQNP